MILILKSICNQRTFIALKVLLNFTKPDNENMKYFVKNDVFLRLKGSYYIKFSRQELSKLVGKIQGFFKTVKEI